MNNEQNIPQHVAIIMDGNGRWAKRKGLPRNEGHKAGVESVRRVIEIATKVGVEYLTLYTFSTENWNRPKEEVENLMELLIWAIDMELENLIENNIRVDVIGDHQVLSEKVQKQLNRCLKATKSCKRLNVIIALNYSGYAEITRATRKIAEKVKMGKIKLDEISPKVIEQHLLTTGYPHPDLLIRTSGEVRISNFLLWQLAYSELYFTDTLWPDFGEKDFRDAMKAFALRERRYGKVDNI